MILMSTHSICFYREIRIMSVFRAENFVCFEFLRPSQPIKVISSAVSLPNQVFSRTGELKNKEKTVYLITEK